MDLRDQIKKWRRLALSGMCPITTLNHCGSSQAYAKIVYIAGNRPEL